MPAICLPFPEQFTRSRNTRLPSGSRAFRSRDCRKFGLGTPILALAALAGLLALSPAAQAQTSCKVCAEQRQACMKNYAGPACKTEYQMCLKACKK